MESDSSPHLRRKTARASKLKNASKESGKTDSISSCLDILVDHPASAAAAIHSGLLYGERQADFVMALLNALLNTAKQRGDTIQFADIPPALLLELAALMQLKVWEMVGIAPESLGLPSSQEAALELCRRIQRDKSQIQMLEAAELEARVAEVWFQRFAWHASVQLDADVVGGDLDVDVAVEAMAQLLWTYRKHSKTLQE